MMKNNMEIKEDLYNLIFEQKMITISGQRACGKTSFVMELIKPYINTEKKILIIAPTNDMAKHIWDNLDRPKNVKCSNVKSLKNICSFRADIIINDEILFFDEIKDDKVFKELNYNDFTTIEDELYKYIQYFFQTLQVLKNKKCLIINTCLEPNILSFDSKKYQALCKLSDANFILSPTFNGKLLVSGNYDINNIKHYSDCITMINLS